MVSVDDRRKQAEVSEDLSSFLRRWQYATFLFYFVIMTIAAFVPINTLLPKSNLKIYYSILAIEGAFALAMVIPTAALPKKDVYWLHMDAHLGEWGLAKLIFSNILILSVVLLFLDPLTAAHHLKLFQSMLANHTRIYYFIVLSTVYTSIWFASTLAIYICKIRLHENTTSIT